jgi:hypothetical protein
MSSVSNIGMISNPGCAHDDHDLASHIPTAPIDLMIWETAELRNSMVSLEILSQLSPGYALESALCLCALPAKGALADLDRTKQAAPVAHAQRDRGARLCQIPGLHRDIDGVFWFDFSLPCHTSPPRSHSNPAQTARYFNAWLLAAVHHSAETQREASNSATGPSGASGGRTTTSATRQSRGFPAGKRQ